MDHALQQFFAAQTQLLQNLTATVKTLPPPPPQPRDKHMEIMSHHPPTYSHSSDSLDADDWLKTVTKKLETVQCTDREMVLYVAGRLTGQAVDWWDAYTVAHAAPNCSEHGPISHLFELILVIHVNTSNGTNHIV
jgi:hypothetical protein